MKIFKIFGFLSIFILIACFSSACGKADSGGTEVSETTSTLTGTVESITSSLWIIAGKPVHVTDDVIIKGTVIVGDEVSAHVHLDENAEYWASQIELISHGTPKETARPTQVEGGMQTVSEFSGMVEEISSDQWTIGGQIVMIESQTEIKGNPKIGNLVRVHAIEGEDGMLIALEIKPTDVVPSQNDQTSTFEFSGNVEAMEMDHWLVDGRTVVVTSSTEIDPGISLGDEVKVEGFQGEDGSLIAREIKSLVTN